MNTNDAMLDEIHAAFAKERETLELYREVLRGEANLLDRWAQAGYFPAVSKEEQ